MNIKKIVIVGGGSSGWMTAAFLSKYVHVDISLIESKNIGTIGVGESTIGHINYFMDSLNIKDEDWMKECNATYKTSIKFTNWNSEKRSFHYPFGKFNFSDNPGELMEWFNLCSHNDKYKPHQLAEHFHRSYLMLDQNKLSKNENNEIEGFDFKYDTAYHMDATLFGQYLKNHICLNNINYIQDDVINIIQNEDESIKHLETASGDILEADLFIDCTGFKSLLLGETLKVPFASYKNVLINDKALAAQIPYIDKEKEMEPTTNCTAIENGWCWNTPLWNRIGTGYVYSSKFVSDEQAEREFRNHLASSNMVIGDKKRAEEVEMFKLNIKHGIHEKIWHKNVVAIGLSAGFIEPLESTGLMLTHETARYLVRTLTQRNHKVNSFDIKGFNTVTRDTMEGFRSFISMHYALSNRDDTPYWKHVTENIDYKHHHIYEFTTENDKFKEVMDGLLMRSNVDASFGGIIYIMSGQGYNPLKEIDIETIKQHPQKQDMLNRWKVTEQLFEKNRDEMQQLVDLMPSHYEFLFEEFYG